MKKSRFSETQMVHMLKEYEAGKSAADVCGELGITRATWYNWHKKHRDYVKPGSEASAGTRRGAP